MSTTTITPPRENRRDSAASEQRQRRQRKRRGDGVTLLANGEPIIWLNGFGLVICLCMILGLLGLVVYQGTGTFWSKSLVQMQLIDDTWVLGEITRNERHEINYTSYAVLGGVRRERAGELLHPLLRERFAQWSEQEQIEYRINRVRDDARRSALAMLTAGPQMRDAPASARNQLIDAVTDAFEDPEQVARWIDQFAENIRPLLADETGQALYGYWSQMEVDYSRWLNLSTVEEMYEQLQANEHVLYQLWGDQVFGLLSMDLYVQMYRRLVRTGNFELTGEHFNWVSDYEIAEGTEQKPEWAVLFERLMGGRFYGTPTAFLIDGQVVADTPSAAWQAFQSHHPVVRARWRERRQLELRQTGAINRQLESIRLNLRRIALRSGTDSARYAEAYQQAQSDRQRLEAEFAVIRQQIQAIDRENARFQLQVTTAQDQQTTLAVADVVRAYPANQLTLAGKVGVYFSRWGEFLGDEPREANSEGGVLPAIWGTVTMTLLMSVAVVPFGVLAALYLREYAKAGAVVSTVRVAINNLAGVPSIVFGVFGLGFFCYIIGASIDQLFFETKLPTPTFGTGGLLWASLTLALLTLPVVIVATEEALAAVPRTMREGSLACGATKWQTIRRIVLPRAMPGIMTGMILAMARGAGEVAPLMLVGAVKLARDLPIDTTFPFIHLDRSFMHLGFHIYDVGFQSQNSEAAIPMVFTTTLLLITLIALMNLIAVFLRARLRKRFEYSQF